MPLSVSGTRPPGGALSGAALLNAHSDTSDPAKAIADAAVTGQLDEKRLAALIIEAAQRPLVANYTQELRARSERMFVEQFHRSLLKNGRADAILDSLHPSFDTAAEAIAAARDVIPTEAPGRKIFAHCTTGRAGRLAGLGRTPERDRPIDRIGRIAAQFGPRNGTSRSSRSTRSATDSGSRIGQSGAPTASTSNQTPARSASPTAGTAHHRGFGFPCG